MITYAQLCFLLITAFADIHPACPAQGEPMPADFIPIILYAAGWDDDFIMAGRFVATRESYWNTQEGEHFVYPWEGHEGDNGLALGLFQIHWYLWGDYFSADCSPYDPVCNAHVAWQIVQYDLARDNLGRQWHGSWPGTVRESG
jgi:hypothetical protein